MDLHALLVEIRQTLINAFKTIDGWFDTDAALRAYTPSGGGWTINEVLEHVALTNHFLLILVDKGGRKALEAAQGQDLQAALSEYHFHREGLDAVGRHRSFEWIRPEHMEPKGEKPLAEVRSELQEQLARCPAWLDKMPNGEGAFYQTTMSVNALGKIDVYEYLYFIAQHALRHGTQMQRIADEYPNHAA